MEATLEQAAHHISFLDLMGATEEMKIAYVQQQMRQGERFEDIEADLDLAENMERQHANQVTRAVNDSSRDERCNSRADARCTAT